MVARKRVPFPVARKQYAAAAPAPHTDVYHMSGTTEGSWKRLPKVNSLLSAKVNTAPTGGLITMHHFLLAGVVPGASGRVPGGGPTCLGFGESRVEG